MDNFKIELNQNLWALIVSLIALGASEYYELSTLYRFGFILSILTSISFFITLIAYTYIYCKNKFNK